MECLKILVLMFVSVNSESKPTTFESKSTKWLIHMARNFEYPVEQDFRVFWNAPTSMCKQYGMWFEKKLQKYGITVNTGDEFLGDKIVILYDPGEFPVTIKHDSGSITEKNGGIPQKGNIDNHLKVFKEVIERDVSEKFNGLGVIDFEAWRPIFRQNWNKQTVYRDLSVELLKNTSSNLKEQEVHKTAADEFEKYAREFMEKTLIKAKQLRPEAKWGFYGYPYCYGFRGERTPHCPDMVLKENNKINWLFSESDALYPSIYVSSNLTTKEQEGFYVGKLNEAWRMARFVSKKKTNFRRVFPYFWFKYKDNQNFLSKNDTKQAFEITKKYQMGGMIIWGSSKNVDTELKCKNLWGYIENVLGPIVLEVTKKSLHIEQPPDISHISDKSQSDALEQKATARTRKRTNHNVKSY